MEEKPKQDFQYATPHNLGKRLDDVVKDLADHQDLVNAVKVAIRIALKLTNYDNKEEALKKKVEEYITDTDFWNDAFTAIKRVMATSLSRAFDVHSYATAVWDIVFDDFAEHAPGVLTTKDTDDKKWVPKERQSLLEFLRWLMTAKTASEFEELEADKRKLELELENAMPVQKQTDAMNNKLRNQVDDLSKKLAEKDGELQAERAQLADTQAKNQDLANKAVEAAQDASAKQAELSSVLPKLAEAQQKAAKLQKDLDAAKLQNADQGDQLDALQKDLDEQKNGNDALQAANDQLDAEKKALQAKLDAKTAELDKGKADVEKLKRDLDNANKAAERLRAELDKKPGADPKAAEQIAQLGEKDKEIAELKAQLLKCEQEKAQCDKDKTAELDALKDKFQEELKKCAEEKQELENALIQAPVKALEEKRSKEPPELGWKLEEPAQLVGGTKLHLTMTPVVSVPEGTKVRSKSWKPRKLFVHAAGWDAPTTSDYVKKLETKYSQYPVKPTDVFPGDKFGVMSKRKGEEVVIANLQPTAQDPLKVVIRNQQSDPDGIDTYKDSVDLRIAKMVPLNLESTRGPVRVLVTTGWDGPDGLHTVTQQVLTVDLAEVKRVKEEPKDACPPCEIPADTPKPPAPQLQPQPQPQPPQSGQGENEEEESESESESESKGDTQTPERPLDGLEEITTADGRKVVKFSAKIPKDKFEQMRVEITTNIQQFTDLSPAEREKVQGPFKVQAAGDVMSNTGQLAILIDTEWPFKPKKDAQNRVILGMDKKPILEKLEPVAGDILEFELHPSYQDRSDSIRFFVKENPRVLGSKNSPNTIHPRKRYDITKRTNNAPGNNVYTIRIYPQQDAYFPIGTRAWEHPRALLVWQIGVFPAHPVNDQKANIDRKNPIYWKNYTPSEERLEELAEFTTDDKGDKKAEKKTKNTRKLYKFTNGKVLKWPSPTTGPYTDYIAVYAPGVDPAPSVNFKAYLSEQKPPTASAPMLSNIARGIGNMIGIGATAPSDSESSDDEERELTEEIKRGLEDVY